jgi:hypothetical protein
MTDVPKQEPLVINKPYKPNTLGAHTAPLPRGKAPPLPPQAPPRENPNNPFKRTAAPQVQTKGRNPFMHTPSPMPPPQTYDDDDCSNQIPINDSPEP